MKARRLIPVTVFLILPIVACGRSGDAEDAPSDTSSAMDAEATATAQAAACFLRGATPEAAAGRPSPLDSTMVDLGGAQVKVCYGAPSANERDVMGGLVPFDAPWRFGANEATEIHLPFPATIGGVSVDAGSYSIYAIPSAGDWTIVVNRNIERWGIPINDGVREADVGSTTVSPEATDGHVERMVLRLDRVSDTEANLVMEWENTRVRIPVARGGG